MRRSAANKTELFREGRTLPNSHHSWMAFLRGHNYGLGRVDRTGETRVEERGGRGGGCEDGYQPTWVREVGEGEGGFQY